MVAAAELLSNKMFSDADEAWGYDEGTHRGGTECITDAWDGEIIEWKGQHYLVVGWDVKNTGFYLEENDYGVPVAVAVARWNQELIGGDDCLFIVSEDKVLEPVRVAG